MNNSDFAQILDCNPVHYCTDFALAMSTYQWRIQDFRGGAGAILRGRGRGRRVIILLNFPKNCMQSRKMLSLGGLMLQAPPLIWYCVHLPRRTKESEMIVQTLEMGEKTFFPEISEGT